MESRRGPLVGMGLTGKALFGTFSSDFLPQAGLGYAEGVYPRGAKPDGVVATMRAIMADAAANGVPAELTEAARSRAIADLDDHPALGLGHAEDLGEHLHGDLRGDLVDEVKPLRSGQRGIDHVLGHRADLVLPDADGARREPLVDQAAELVVARPIHVDQGFAGLDLVGPQVLQ